ncbi:MAG: tRNA uridine(34) 5-carboxymethylaminomethyl modification radical SAM/GNAT enzyme Elp3 [Candidatus Bathyarchaeota archaeon]|nr:MAG: tRNA uridine(34) 5-carboxymethylaminomethyl modification radical SAM/GNAT enzyme Elp3 [Candidatus Bathyarchaeota archaeon]
MFVDEFALSNEACREIIGRLMRLRCPSREDVNLVKMRVAGQYKLEHVPSSSELICCLRPDERVKLLPLFRRKITRSISGITMVAVMTKPWPCPKVVPCAYCPGGPPYGAPQSYTGYEPAAMRGIQNEFDPYRQVSHRIGQLEAIGHVVDKVELIVMGGTFLGMPVDYQECFVQRCLDAITEKDSGCLDEAKKLAETSRVRNVGVTVETRPDWAREVHVDRMLSLGVTRVELGVQNVFDDVYELVDRGHKVEDVVEATRVLKDSGLKVVYHVMPGLPSSGFERDLEGFRRIFGSSDFKPDMIKIYPCLVLKGTRIYDWWKSGEYEPYSTDEAAELVFEVKRLVPSWVRVMRVQRDIPAFLIEAGVDRSNLRQLVLRKLRARGLRCRCMRCREVGHRWLTDGVKPDPDNIQMLTHKEKASGGEEVFLSFEDPINDVLVGYLRLRIPSESAHRSEICGGDVSVVRALHVYGPLVPVGAHVVEAWQHKGFGEALLGEAERISREDYDCRKIVVISAVGAKRYYMRFGYGYDGPYMSKTSK